MERKRNTSVIVMAVLLLLAVAFIGYGYYNNYDDAKLQDAYQQGFVDAQTVLKS